MGKKSGEASQAFVLVTQYPRAERIDAGEACGRRLSVDVAGRQAIREQTGHCFVEVACGQRNSVAVGCAHLPCKLSGGGPGEACGSQTRLGSVQVQTERILD